MGRNKGSENKPKAPNETMVLDDEKKLTIIADLLFEIANEDILGNSNEA